MIKIENELMSVEFHQVLDDGGLTHLIGNGVSKFLISLLSEIRVINLVTCLNAELYEQAIKYEKGSFITASGALATLSGAKTGRSPKDKRVVRDETTEDVLWWGKYVSLAFNQKITWFIFQLMFCYC